MGDEGKGRWLSSVREDDNDDDRAREIRKRKRSNEDEVSEKDGDSEIPSNPIIEENYLRSCHCQETKARTQSVPCKTQLIETWLDETCHSQYGPDIEPSPPTSPYDMSPKSARALPFGSDTLSTCATSAGTSANVRDSNYHESLALRNIFIEGIDPPSELMKRARKIMTHRGAGSQADDATVQELVRVFQGLRNENEDILIGALSAIIQVPDERLKMSGNQHWSNSVPIALAPGTINIPPRLPKPKPDRAFGYSRSAFTGKQRGTIGLLVDDESGKSYAMPDNKLRFPFLSIEFKSQANGGTHYTATNQVAGAGSIALYGHLELMKRSSRVQKLDINEPQFFSATMDHELVRINVHWLRIDPSEGDAYNFHVVTVERYWLNEEEGVRAAMQAIQNILNHSLGSRLKGIRKSLNKYREDYMAAKDAEVIE
ncbi:hypothetical protein VE03_08737 [Pseudogymnoascus sp. 23342-1-I1]|nr:hypothetical protein VE03_08737 [Pseudogymnoascus sp. 23342-1-I1]